MEPISPPIRELLDVFSTSLTEVKFGDLDAEVLEAKAAEVRAAAAHVASVQMSLDAARLELDAQQDALSQLAQRAMAYARVYAENNGALSAALEAIALPRAIKRPARVGSSASSASTATFATSGQATNDGITDAPDSSPRQSARRGRPRKEADSSQAELAVVAAE